MRISDRISWGGHRTLVPWVILGIAYGVSMTITPFFYDGLGLGEGVIGWLTGAQGVGVIAAAGFSRRLIHRLGAARAFSASVLLYAVLVTCFGQMTHPLLLGVARFFDGALAVVAVIALEVALVSSTSMDATRARKLGAMASSGALGFCLGALGAKGLFSLLSFPLLFAIAGGVALLAALSGEWLLASSSATSSKEDVDVDGAETRASDLAARKRITSEGKHALFGAFVYGVFHATWIVLMPLAVMQITGLPEANLLWLAPLHIIGVILATPVLVRYFSGVLGMGILSVLCAIAIASVLLTGDLRVHLALVFLIGGASAALQASILTALLGIAHATQGSSIANTLNAAFGAAGKVLGPILLGSLAAYHGPRALLGSLAGLWGLCALFFFSTRFLSASSRTTRTKA